MIIVRLNTQDRENANEGKTNKYMLHDAEVNHLSVITQSDPALSATRKKQSRCRNDATPRQ